MIHIMQTLINTNKYYVFGENNMPIKVTDLSDEIVAVYLFLKENKELAYTQKELSKELNLDQSTITRQTKRLIEQKQICSQKNHSAKGSPFVYYYNLGNL